MSRRQRHPPPAGGRSRSSLTSSSFAPVRGSDDDDNDGRDNADDVHDDIELTDTKSHQSDTNDNNNNINGAADNNADSDQPLQDEIIMTVDDETRDDDDDDDLLTKWQAALLLTADCLGTGLLALPQSVHVLGRTVGLGFLCWNLPINWYAGTLLSNVAWQIEQEQQQQQQQQGGEEQQQQQQQPPVDTTITVKTASEQRGGAPVDDDDDDDDAAAVVAVHDDDSEDADETTHDYIGMTHYVFSDQSRNVATTLVMAIYYTNIVLVLGDYILVMSHAVRSFTADALCLPTSGLVASTLMFGLAQIRTMAHLGHSVALLSLLALSVVVVQCLLATTATTSSSTTPTNNDDNGNGTTTMTSGSSNTADTTVEYFDDESFPLLRKLSALASIGFATGPNKLLLNIRKEMSHRKQAPQTLGISIAIFGLVYILICVLAGPDPPPFLFDAIPEGWGRQLAGLLLWCHVAVSYAINSQAICSSMDRRFFLGHTWMASSGKKNYRTTHHHQILQQKEQQQNSKQNPDHEDVEVDVDNHNTNGNAVVITTGSISSLSSSLFDFRRHPEKRWFVLSLGLAISSYLLANVVPFFKDLVALIGALTAVPLTMLLPILFHRKFHGLFLWKSGSTGVHDDRASFALLLFSLVFLLLGLIGAIGSIELDWAHHGKPFSCTL